ncbi:hypothetical protein [Candidatus Pyrohabitans sp.]
MAGSIPWIIYIIVLALLLLNVYHYMKVKSLEKEISTLKREGEKIRRQVHKLKSDITSS